MDAFYFFEFVKTFEKCYSLSIELHTQNNLRTFLKEDIKDSKEIRISDSHRGKQEGSNFVAQCCYLNVKKNVKIFLTIFHVYLLLKYSLEGQKSIFL